MNSIQALINSIFSTVYNALGVHLSSQIAGEDLTNDVMKVNQVFSYSNVTASGATVVKSTAGFLHGITFNQPVSGVTTVLTDNSGAGGTIIATIALPAQTYNRGPFFLPFNVSFATGLTASQVSGTANGQNMTFSYR